MEACLYSILVLFAVTSSRTQETSTTEEDWCPYFVEPIPNVTVPLGREAILICVVRNLGQYKVGWIRAEDQTVLSLHTKVVTHNSRISVSHDSEHGIWKLHIRQLRHSDRGCYMCQINTTRMKKQIGCIDVHVPPDIVDSESSSDITVLEGDNVTLSCRARGRPQPRIVWKREDGKPITAYNHSAGFTTVDSWSGATLQILQVDFRQMGAYLCIATNDIPPAVSKRIVLVVNFAPVTQSPPDRRRGATLGSTISLSCMFYGHPNENTSWQREIGSIQQYGGDYTFLEQRNSYEVSMDLTIRNLRPIDLGKYYCSLVNQWGVARATIYVYEIRHETSTTERIPRAGVSKARRKPPGRRTTTTELIPVLPTYTDDIVNEISELAVEAESRRGDSGTDSISPTLLYTAASFLLLIFSR